MSTREVSGLEEDTRERVVRASTLTAGFCQRSVDLAVLGVVHEHRALGDTVGDHRTCRHDTVTVDCLNPVIVLDADLLRVSGAHPHGLATASQREHVQVVVVLGVDRPLVVRGQVAYGHLRTAVSVGGYLAQLRLTSQGRQV